MPQVVTLNEKIVAKTARSLLRGKNSDGDSDDITTIRNELMDVKFDKEGKLMSINGQAIEQTWGYYTSFDNNRMNEEQTSETAGRRNEPRFQKLQVGGSVREW